MGFALSVGQHSAAFFGYIVFLAVFSYLWGLDGRLSAIMWR